MVTKYAESVLEGISDAYAPKRRAKKVSASDFLSEMEAVRETGRQYQRDAAAQLRSRHSDTISRRQLKIAVHRALEKVASE